MQTIANSKFRSDIQSLRAIAVLLVIFNHGDFKFFEGGYIGVDIFFVISGYLISSNVENDLIAKRFSFSEFYARRAKRIFPALFFTLALSTLGAWILMLNQDIATFGSSLTYASLFASNIYFTQDVDYFTSSSSVHPLLHTWSLAVEEQFYILFPIFLFSIKKFSNAISHRIAIGLLLVSFLICIIGSQNFPIPNFYSLITRSWEFLLGYSLVVYGERIKKSLNIYGAQKQLGNWGLLFIAIGLMLLKNETPYPSAWTLLPVIGAMLVILDNRANSQHLILSNKILVFIGGISYSLYLAHFPIFTFSKLYESSSGINIAMEIQLLLILAAAYFSYYFVESPLRHAKATNTKVICISIITISAFSALGQSLMSLSQHWKPMSEQQLNVISKFEKNHENSYWEICTKSPPCTGGDQHAKNKIVLWGDSHAYSLYRTLSDRMEQLNLKLVVYTNGICPPIFETSVKARSNECMSKNLKIFNEIREDSTIKGIVLVARWAWYLNVQPFNNGQGGIGDKKSTFLEREYSTNDRKKYILSSIEDSLDKIANIRTPVFVVDTIPEPGWNVLKKSLYLNDTIGNIEASMRYPVKSFNTRNEVADKLFTKIAQTHLNSVWLIQPKDVFCKLSSDMHCVSWSDGMPLYSDDNHLTKYGADMLVKFIFDNYPINLGVNRN